MTGAQRAADPLDRVAPTRRSRSGVRLGIGLRVPTLRRLVCIELVLALLCAAAIAAGFSMRTVLVVAVLTTAIPFVTTAGRTPFDWAVTAIRYASGWAPSVGTTTDHIDVDGNPFGVHRNGDLVSCILELRPAEGAATRLGRAGATTDSTLDLGTLARCLTQHDISLSGIDVVSHGRRTASGTPAADVYERLIGPLPAVADRTVWVTVTADLRSNTEAVRVRGGGSVGAAATVRIATERVARALDAQGVASTVLTRNQIRDAVSHLCRGVTTDDLTQNWRTAPLPGAAATGYEIDCRAIDEELLADVWATPSLSTTVSLRLTPGAADEQVNLSGFCNLVTRSGAPALDAPGLSSMNGRHRLALLLTLPIAVPAPGHTEPGRRIARTRASELSPPTSGCGQLLGSDASGHGIATRMHGRGVRSVLVAGELYLAQQLVFRAVATGARILVRTDRPHAWRPLVDSLATPDNLRIDDGARRNGPSIDLVVQDFTDAVDVGLPSRFDGTTVLTLTEHPSLTPMRDPDVSIVQPGAAGDRVLVRTSRHDIELILVTIAQETAFIGRPRSVRNPVGTY
ncbi:MAG: type VII secretion protein EccE [Rhodococcus sp. (in: high G+C Gram-positive bacteria)]